MTKNYLYKTHGTCSSLINIKLDDDVVTDVTYTNGCNGNLQGIGALTRGMKLDDVIERLEGIRCGMKNTSCPDQLANALKAIKSGELLPEG
ncbi:MAG: TIGR03905 family TSCPD domain-containing protein [Catonella sp.]|jgi:uncharacterized protein (TIGR03905 family)|nr:TIGR03905 family TSCPD domain-containing protein [Catonella sp.]MDY6355868.1 TIGR03905 family TSCPD domain-containing protein [Catonella sp.]